ncbi:general stress protein [Bacillus thermotolerans]|uniref:general stress protein n=1 Tax=Bacillus thermotolerans TaxID=1221996 RepID=UPI0005827A3D|nr:general stress protein [Bacillus thermotolerans]KKB37145.1 Succinyl-CoA ligase [ADP-forming] beta chain [Bacillus thermotolerans]KKB42617.1 Succinyl-CoA ligase [ADP-forming] beta chain [Bacillus thermotolerans]
MRNDHDDKKIVGVYDTQDEAVEAIEDLKREGYNTDEISIITKNRDEAEYVEDTTDTKAEEGAGAGAATGGVLGGLAGVAAGAGALAIPGIGPVVAAGPIVAGLTGAAAGAGVGGLTGALIGLGIPEDQAEEYSNYVKEGKILVLVDREARVVQGDDRVVEGSDRVVERSKETLGNGERIVESERLVIRGDDHVNDNRLDNDHHL